MASGIESPPILFLTFASGDIFLLFAIHQVNVQWGRPLLLLAMAATAALLPASCAPRLPTCKVTLIPRLLFCAPRRHSLPGRCGAPLARLRLSDQAVDHPCRASIALPPADAHELRTVPF